MEDENVKYKNMFKKLDVYQKIFGNKAINSAAKDYLETTLQRLFLIGQDKNPYYFYFFQPEIDSKENLLMMHQNIKNNRFQIATFLFFGYNVTKAILWRFGYFAYFFYHTRMMSLALYGISVYLINKNFNANLLNDDLISYKQKSENFKTTFEKVSQNIEKSKLINDKINNNI